MRSQPLLLTRDSFSHTLLERERVLRMPVLVHECPICLDEEGGPQSMVSCKRCGGLMHLSCAAKVPRCPLCRHETSASWKSPRHEQGRVTPSSREPRN